MSTRQNEVAEYIFALRDAADATHQAEDRPIYERYLAEAAVLLALIEKDSSKDVIANAVQGHERLRGHTWLQDPIFEKSSKIWEKVKKCISKL